MFWPTFSCQILITCSFLESLWHKERDCTSFAKKFLQIIFKQLVNGNLHIFSFSELGYLKFFKHFCIFEMEWSRAFQKCLLDHFWTIFFSQTFLLYNWILQKKFYFCKFAIFFADFKSRAQEISNGRVVQIRTVNVGQAQIKI